ncbi:MAG: hypothetical protein WCJ72_02530 [Chryseobacterium sp.]
MEKPIYSAVVAYVLSALNVKELPTDDKGALALSAEQDATLKSEFPGDLYANVLNNLNSHLAVVAKAAKDSDDAKVAEKQNVLDILAGKVKEDPVEAGNPEKDAKDLSKTVEEQQAVIENLSKQPEAESGMKNMLKTALVGTALAAAFSSGTHLFGKQPEAVKDMFSFEGRNWNAKAAGKSAAKTDFNDTSTIARLNADLKEYQIQNPNFIRDLYTDTYGLPTFWPKRVGVIDMVQDVVMDISNVTQARKPDWTPGFEMFLDAEKRRIFRIQIDLEFDGYQLQELETAWLASIYNMEGSSPYKNSFVAFLVSKITIKARQEDREGAINGIFVPSPAGIKAKGHYLNGQSGIRHQLFMFRDVLKRITPYISKVGKFSSANAYDYAKGFIESLPLGIRTKANMKFYLSPSNIVKIRDSYKAINALHNDYTGNQLNYIDGYPNITFEGVNDFEGSNLMFITDDQNIEILEYLPEEKNKYRFEYLKRKTFVHADYRTGCGFIFSGFDLPQGSGFKGIAQFIWINDEPIFPETVTAPLFGKAMSAPVDINYNKLQIHAELISDVVKLQGLPAGTIVRLLGNKLMTTNSVIKKSTGGNGGNLSLTADFKPKEMYSLTMVVQTDLTYKEVSRTEAFPEDTATAMITFDDLVVDASEGLTQKYVGVAAGTLESIVGGNASTELTIYGSANVLTVENVPNKIVVDSDAVLDAETKYIKLKNFEGIWYEIARN